MSFNLANATSKENNQSDANFMLKTIKNKRLECRREGYEMKEN